MYKVGQQVKRWKDVSRQNWSKSDARPLTTVIWYPADGGAEEEDFLIGAPEPLFLLRDVARDAPVLASPRVFPVVLLSHGTGGSAFQLGWLGRALAAQGHIAVAVNHHGNTSIEPYVPHGFLLWWERAKDLTAALDQLLADPLLGDRVDVARIGAAGFSLGGYTALTVVGGRCSLEHFFALSRANGESAPAGPREFPDVGKVWDELMNTDPAFVNSFAEHARSYRDERIKAAFVMNPALGGAFDAGGLADIRVPVHIVVTAGDQEVPPLSNGSRYANHIASAELTWIDGPAGHYVFLAEPTAAGKKQLPLLCVDDPLIDRRAIQDAVADLACSFFEQHLVLPSRSSAAY